jgi:hypothetical protein
MSGSWFWRVVVGVMVLWFFGYVVLSSLIPTAVGTAGGGFYGVAGVWLLLVVCSSFRAGVFKLRKSATLYEVGKL